MLQTWVIEGVTYEPAPIALERVHSEYQRPFSVAYFCPFCGEIWARRIVTDTGPGRDPEWSLWHRPCSKHPNSISRGLSGSVWLGHNIDVDRGLPLPVLKREALIHLRANNYQLSEPKHDETSRIPSQAEVQCTPSPEQEEKRLVSARERFTSKTK